MSLKGQLFLTAIAHLCAACLLAQVELPRERVSLPAWPGSPSAAQRMPGQFVFQDATGEIIVSYPHASNPAHYVTFRFWLQNRVAPKITVTVRRDSDGDYRYNYSVENGSAAKTSIRQWSLAGTPSAETAISHPIWQGVNAYKAPNAQNRYKNDPSNVYLSWIDMRAAQPIEPGRVLSGFEIVSPLRPGLTVAYVGGTESPITVPDNCPDEVDLRIMQLEQRPIMEKIAVTIGPRFTQETDAREIVRAFRRDIREAMKGGFLDANSKFLRGLMNGFLVAEGSGPFTFRAPIQEPGSPLEREILDALRVALAAR